MTEFDRASSLRRLTDESFDVVVIGGGITGAGVALDAASRGLRTALVERDDFASGTSSKSSKLIHGGLRYLQQGEVGLVYEALAERQRLRRNAPHLVRVLPFLIPILTRDGLMNAKIARALGTGVWADDVRALDEGTHPQSLRPAKGIHITVPWSKVRNDIAVVIPVPKDRRSLFVVPWGDHTYVGTTDTDYDGSLDDPQCTSDD